MGTNIKFGEIKERKIDFPPLDVGINGHVIFCNGYLSSPAKNSLSYLNVIMDKVPDDPLQDPFRGANMSESMLTKGDDIITNKELNLINRKGGEWLFSDEMYNRSEYARWFFAIKDQFEGYWDGYDNISKKRFSKVFEEYFNARNNSHFINGSHGLQSSGAHRVEHGITQGYAWAKSNWKIKKKSEVEQKKKNDDSVLSYSPAYQPITVVGHSQGAAVAGGVTIGILYFAYEMGWQEIPVNIVFLGTHQPQGLYEKDYEAFEKYYFEDFINEWLLEWISDIFSKEKLKQKEGIYERMNDFLGYKWGGLINRAVQFTFPNDRALFVTRMGDIPLVKNACNENDALQIASWYFAAENTLPNFVKESDGYIFPKRLLDKHFNEDGSVNKKALTFKETVKKYWETYHSYINYRDLVKNNPQLKYEKAKYKIPDIKLLPVWFEIMINKAIRRAEGEKANLYLQSELYRKKLDALMAFAAVHDMELQAHFAPVGLMFNQGTLSDWEMYQDQTIWDRVKEAGKDIFYRVEYSASAIGISQRKKEDKLYVEGQGKERMINTSIVNTSKIREWISKASDELTEEKGWLADLNSWWNGNKEYDGSGWAHGARTEVYKLLGFKDDNINNLFEVGVSSMLQRGKIIINDQSDLKKNLNKDFKLKNREEELAKLIIKDPRYLKQDFNDIKIRDVIEFGGVRGSWGSFVNPFGEKFSQSWKVVVNQLTWLIRHVNVESTAYVKKDGSVRMRHQFEDTFDLRPNVGRTVAYNASTMILGFLYHDAAGGNDLMKIKGDWNNNYNRNNIDWMAMKNDYIKQMKENKKNRIDSLMREWNQADEWNQNVPLFGN